KFDIKTGSRGILVCFSEKLLSKCGQNGTDFRKCCRNRVRSQLLEFPLKTAAPFCPLPEI
ncbi:MAG: hypothetical protein ACK5DR_14425, partial [Planctomyces sp.]